ncbi:hypothetical protein BHE74_00003390, partial [Ensete ventricosum]
PACAVAAGASAAAISSHGSPLIRGSVRLVLAASSRRRLRVLVLHSVSASKRILGIEMFGSLLVYFLLFHSLEQTSAGAVALTDIVFWGLLVPFLSVEHFKLDLVRALDLYNISKENLLPGLVSF